MVSPATVMTPLVAWGEIGRTGSSQGQNVTRRVHMANGEEREISTHNIGAQGMGPESIAVDRPCSAHRMPQHSRQELRRKQDQRPPSHTVLST
jgi:hypothetical protein